MSAAVRFAHVRWRTPEPPAARSRIALEHRLAALDAGRIVNPAAILVARRLTLPLRHTSPALLQDALKFLAARAVRPARSFVPLHCEAVLFADDAELLACLAQAALAGALNEWWWKSLLAGRHDIEAVIGAWLSRPAAMAPALHALDRAGAAAAYLQCLPPQIAAAIYHAMIEHHGLEVLDRLERAAVRPATADAGCAASALETWSSQSPSAGKKAEPDTPVLPPWAGLDLAASSRALPAELQKIVGLAAGLCRAPALVRNAAFAAALERWQVAVRLAGGSQPEMAISTAARDIAGHPSLTAAPGGTSDEAPRHSEHIASPSSPPGADASPRSPVPPPEAAARSAAAGLPSGAAAPLMDTDDPLIVSTRHGGLLFLLNVALQLGLYGDFTAPMARSLTIGPWEWLATMGERLCGARIRKDPIWSLLQHLSDEPDPFPAHDASLSAWRVPQAWLAPFGASPPFFPAGEDGAAAMARYLRARLCLAMGIPKFRHVCRELLQRPARLILTPTRLDAVFELASHPVSVRAAGLDRDPGWIPSAGRDIRMQFT